MSWGYSRPELVCESLRISKRVLGWNIQSLGTFFLLGAEDIPAQKSSANP